MNESTAGLGPASAPGFGVTWGGPPRAAGRALTVAAAAAMIAGMAGPGCGRRRSGLLGRVRLGHRPRAARAPVTGPERAVVALGGTVEQQLAIIGGFEATVPADRLGALRSAAGVLEVVENASVTPHQHRGRRPGRPQRLDAARHARDDRRLGHVGRRVHRRRRGRRADRLGRRPGRRPDAPPARSSTARTSRSRRRRCDRTGCDAEPGRDLDTYGHGTHMAGIIAGRDRRRSRHGGQHRDRAASSAWRRTPGSSASRSLTLRAVPTSRR